MRVTPTSEAWLSNSNTVMCSPFGKFGANFDKESLMESLLGSTILSRLAAANALLLEPIRYCAMKPRLPSHLL